MMSCGKWAPLKLIAIVALLLMQHGSEGETLPQIASNENLRQNPGGAKWSMSALACAIPTMRTSMVARGKAVRSAVSSGRHAITKGMRKTRLIGPDIEWFWQVKEHQIP